VNAAIAYDRDLAEMMARMQRRIVERTGGRVNGLQVDSEPGRIVIRGVVPSYFVKQQVLHAALDSLTDSDEVRLALNLEVMRVPAAPD
jgi:hypothetical protein